jgi:hypothetical protein
MLSPITSTRFDIARFPKYLLGAFVLATNVRMDVELLRQ